MQDKRKVKMCGKLKGTFISCVFDGTTHNKEALAVVCSLTVTCKTS